MPKRLLTPEMISEAIERVVARGEEPTLISVQTELGHGSYSTIKVALDAWRAAQRREDVVVPERVWALFQKAAQQVWVTATDEASATLTRVREELTTALTAAQRERDDALRALRSVEEQAEQREAEQAKAATQFAEITAMLREARNTAQRAAEQSAAVAAERDLANNDRRQLLDRLEETTRQLGRVEHELATLRQQLKQKQDE